MLNRVQSVEPNSYALDYSNRLASGLVAAYPGGSDLNLVTGKRANRIGTAANLQPFQTTLGKATRFNGGVSGGGSAYEDPNIPYYDKNWTVVAIVRSNGSAIIPIVSYGGAFNAGNHGWNFEITNGTWFRYSNGNGGSYDITTSGSGWPIVNKVTVAGLSCYDNGTSLGMDLYLDGIRRGGTGAVYPLSPNTDPFRIGAKSSDGATGTTYVQGDTTPQSPTIGLVLFWNRKLSADEMASITANPWQIFKVNNTLNSLYTKIPSPNPDTLIKYAIGYENSTYFNNVTPSSGQGVSNRHPGYNAYSSWYSDWSTTAFSRTLSISPSAGDFVFLTVVGGSTSSTTTVTDNAGSVWTNIVNNDNDGSYSYSFWYCNKILPGVTSVTAAFSTSMTAKMVAVSYKNMTGSVLNNYAPRQTQVNPGASADSIKSNTSFYNASSYNSSNGAGLIVSTNNALVIGITHQTTGGSTGLYTAGTGYKIRRNYYGILHQDAEYNGMANTQTIINATESGGASNTYTTYGFAFDQPIVSSTWYTAKYGDTITRVRFRASGANGAIARVSLRRVDTNQIIYTTQEFTLTSSATHTAWEIPVAWPLIPGVTYALSLYSVSGTVNISYNDAIGESSHGSQYAVGSTWDDSVVYGDYNADRRYLISGDVTKRLYMNHRTSGTITPTTSTVTTSAFEVEKGDLILLRCVFPSTPTGVVVSDTAGNFYYFDRPSTNGVGTEYLHMYSVNECVTSKKNNQITITNTSALTPSIVQYSVYSSSHPWEQIITNRGVAYSLGAIGTGEVFIAPCPNKSMQLVVSMGNSGNTTSSGDYLTAGLTNENTRQKVYGVAGVNQASLIVDSMGRAAANSAGGSLNQGNYGIPSIQTSLGASNGITKPFSSIWQYASGPHSYRQAVGTTDSGSNVITMMPTRERSLVLIFMQGVSNVLSVSDDKGTVYSRYVDQANNAGFQIFYGYPASGMTKISTSGGNSLAIAIEEPDMALIPLQAYDSSYRDGFYYNVSSIIHNAAPTTFPDIMYLHTGYGFGNRPTRTVDSNTLYPVLTTNPKNASRIGIESGGVDVFTGSHHYEYGDSYHDVFRAEFNQPRSNNNFTIEGITRYIDNFQGTGSALGNITRYLMSVALKKPQLMLGPDTSKWDGYKYNGGNLTNSDAGTCVGAIHVAGHRARFSGWTTSISLVTGVNYNTAKIYLAIYDDDGRLVGKSAEVPSIYYTNQVNYDVYGRIVLPITAYLEKGKLYHIAFFVDTPIYYTVLANPNPDSPINELQWCGLNNYDFSYSYTNPPQTLMLFDSLGFSSTNFGGSEYAIWVEGIPTYSRLNSDGTYESANLIESYE